MSVDRHRTQRFRTTLFGRGMWQFHPPRNDYVKRQKELKLTVQVSQGAFVKTTVLKKTFFFFHGYIFYYSFLFNWQYSDILFGAVFLENFRFSLSQISDNLKHLAQVSMILDWFLRDLKKKKKTPCGGKNSSRALSCWERALSVMLHLKGCVE